MGVDSTRRRAGAFLATGRPAVRAAVERFGAFGAAAVTLRPAFLGAAFLGAAFLSAAFLSATVRAALRGAARFFATLLVAALLFAALLLIALLLPALLFVAAEARRLAAATAGFRAAVCFFATRLRAAAAEVLLARFAAFFRPPVAEPFRFAITRSFRNVRNQQLP